MARKRFKVDFKGFDEMLYKYQSLGGNTKQVIEKCLKAVPDIINPNLKRDIAKHRRRKSNSAADSVAENQQVEWEGTTGRIPVGFEFAKGGLPTIFIMYGTARHAPSNQYGTYSGTTFVPQDTQLWSDIFGIGTKRKINETQKEVFEREIERLWKNH